VRVGREGGANRETRRFSEALFSRGTHMNFNKSLKLLIGSVLLVVLVMLGYKVDQLTASKSDYATSQNRLEVIVNDLTPKDWRIYDKIIHFTPENLYEKINGRAEYYIAYDVIGMTFACFEKKTDSGSYINLSIYDMGTSINAFGVFSGERSSEGQRLELGREAYRSGADYYVWHGQYYIQIIASNTLKESEKVGLKLADELTDLLPDSGDSVWGLTVLPKANRVPQSIQFFLVDAMGLDFMRNTYTAKYYKGETVLSVFLSREDSSESAQKTLNKFVAHAKKYGKGISFISKDNIELVSCDMGNNYDVIFQKEFMIGGVTGVEKESLAIQATVDLWGQL
jgi:hypothetical protein